MPFGSSAQNGELTSPRRKTQDRPPLFHPILCLFPLLAIVLRGRSGWSFGEILRVLLLFALGLAVAWPFLSDRELGADDARTYSNSVADTVTQLRAGTLPVCAGQSEYEFSGAVHPVRTACYFDYMAGLADVLVRHRLSFWGLQNLVLAASLIGAAFSAYICIGKLGTVRPWVAWFLAAAYVLAPGLLAAAYSMDLYMTVCTAPYLPIVLLGLVLSFRDRSFANLGLFAAGIAACWLAHPPVALLVSGGCIIVLLASFAAQPPRWRDLTAVPASIVLCAVLCGYGFAASMTFDPGLMPTGYNRTAPGVVNGIEAFAKQALPGSLLPVSESVTSLSDFQLGYLLWLLLFLAAGMAVRRRSGVAAALGAMAAFYLVMTTPVPWLHRALWANLPGTVFSMVNFWPMQRVYLILAAVVVFMAAVVWPRRGKGILVFGLALAGLGWSGWEAWHFVKHGWAGQRSAEETAETHRPENVLLGINSYAFLGYPSWFTYGPMDPEDGFRLLNPAGATALATNLQSGGILPPVASGRFRLGRAEGAATLIEPSITIEPGRKYRLHFHFLQPKIDALMYLRGETTSREQILPNGVATKGFGMNPGNRPELTLFTTSSRAEHITLSLAGRDWQPSDFADFTLTEIDRSALPVRLIRLVPALECVFDAPRLCWLETPRMFILGYTARVDGQPAVVAGSPENEVMVLVPAGQHTLELRCTPSPLLRWSFWACVSGWCAMIVLALGRFTFSDSKR